MKRPIYLDYAATTPVDERVMCKMMQYMGVADNFGNAASSSHVFGWEAEEAIDQARRQVAHLIKAKPREIIWTSGATEADNLAIKGVAHFYQKRGNHIITVKTEHKAVLDSARQLEREGFEITYLQPQTDGLIDLDELAQAITDKTLLVSVMHVNNETGVVQDIKAISQLTRAKKVFLHVDAAQSAGKIVLDMNEMAVDLLSISAHKMYGPKGIGALYVRRSPKVRLAPLIHGGGHEQGLRSGTLPTHQIVGMGEAAAIALEHLETEGRRICGLRDALWAGLQQLDAVYLNGHPSQRSPGHLNVSFDCVEGEALLMALQDIAVSSGSACTSASLEPSYVLQAMGIEAELAQSTLRFCIGRYTTEQEIKHTVAHVIQHVQRLRNMSPLWQSPENTRVHHESPEQNKRNR